MNFTCFCLLLNVATRTSKVTHVAHALFPLDSTVPTGARPESPNANEGSSLQDFGFSEAAEGICQ